MNPTLFGVPLGLYGVPCFLLAFAFLFVWPHNLETQSGWRQFVLRWGHSLVWLLLGLAAFVGGTGAFGGLPTAGGLALISVLVYIIFVMTMLTTKRRPSNTQPPR
jgi:hypothetical protein